MGNLLRIDGPLYIICTYLYRLLTLNLLWILLSLPLVTVGPATIALFFVAGKIARREEVEVGSDFWEAFRGNFRQGIAIWLVLAGVAWVAGTNLNNIQLFGRLGFIVWPVQWLILIELWIAAIYVFPLLARYELATFDAVKAALLLGNRHLPVSFVCSALAFLLLQSVLLWGWPVFLAGSLFASCTSLLLQGVFTANIIVEKKEANGNY